MNTVNMIRLILFIGVAISASWAFDIQCLKLGRPEVLKCCNRPIPELEGLGECFSQSKPPPNCDADICFARKHDFAGSEDGKMDKKKLEAFINKKFEGVPEAAETIIKECLNNDISDYGPSDFCELTKFRHCFHVKNIETCPEWNGDGECAETKQLVDKCKH